MPNYNLSLSTTKQPILQKKKKKKKKSSHLFLFPTTKTNIICSINIFKKNKIKK